MELGRERTSMTWLAWTPTPYASVAVTYADSVQLLDFVACFFPHLLPPPSSLPVTPGWAGHNV